jgi:hypothetical protein
MSGGMVNDGDANGNRGDAGLLVLRGSPKYFQKSEPSSTAESINGRLREKHGTKRSDRRCHGFVFNLCEAHHLLCGPFLLFKGLLQRLLQTSGALSHLPY